VSQTQLEVIIPHRSRWDLLSRLLESLTSQTVPVSVCVVDNASEDESTRMLAKADVRLLTLAENVGFGRAINAGARSSDAEFVVFLNNDMVAEPQFAEAMLESLASDREVAVNAMQLRPDGRIDSLGVAVDQSLCAYDLAHGLEVDRRGDEPLRPLGPSGGAAGYRRQTFIDVGGYDEQIFAYLEDVDLGLRLATRGVEYRLSEDARVVHAHSSTLGSGSREKNRLMGQSRGYLLWKYRESISRASRMRGAVIDGATLAGQIVLDRNLGMLAGRMAATRDHQGSPEPRHDLPLNHISTRAALARKLARR